MMQKTLNYTSYFLLIIETFIFNYNYNIKYIWVHILLMKKNKEGDI